MKRTVQDCFDVLARGKLSNLALVNSNDELKDKFVLKVLDAMNEALIRLYTDFPIKENGVVVKLIEGKTQYKLSSEHSIRKMKFGEDFVDEMKVDPGYYWDYYIIDTDREPFIDDILAIIEVYTEHGDLVPLNDHASHFSVYTPVYDTIVLNGSWDWRPIEVVYKAKHPHLKGFKTEIEIPEMFLGAFYSYVAYLVWSDIGTQEAVANSAKYYGEYQNIVNDAQINSLINQERLNQDWKFHIRGWI